jgi:hypothetical protein
MFIEPGRPWEKGYCKSFNSKLRDECLNGEIFYSLYSQSGWHKISVRSDERLTMSRNILVLLAAASLLGVLPVQAQLRNREIPVANWSAPSLFDATSLHTKENQVEPGLLPNAASGAALTQLMAFVGIVPCRLVDTRDTSLQSGFGPPTMAANQVRTFAVNTNTRCGIPTNAQAYSLNFTVVPLGPLTNLGAWPTPNRPNPDVSILNALTGQIIANPAVVPAGTDGSIDVFVTDPTDVVIDINGYYVPSSSTSPQWSTNGSDTFYTGGRVGVGTSTPSQALDIFGIGRFTGGIMFGDGTTQTTAATTGGGGRLGLTGFASLTPGATTTYMRGDATIQTLNTSAVPEGTNQYFTTARAQSAMSGLYQTPISNYSFVSALTGYPSTFAPSAHASTHASGGGDPLQIAESQVTGLVTHLAAKTSTSSLATVATSGSYSDLTNKPTLGTIASHNTADYQAALGFPPENAANRGQPNGYASLDNTGKVPTSQLPSSSTSGASIDRIWLTQANGTVAGTSLTLPFSNAPTPSVTVGTNIPLGILTFPAASKTSGFGSFPITANVPSSLTLEIMWRTTDKTGGHGVTWNWNYACSGTTIDPVLTSAGTVTTTALSTSNQTQISTVTLSTVSCTAGQTFYFQILRRGDTDSITSGVDVSSVRIHN